MKGRRRSELLDGWSPSVSVADAARHGSRRGDRTRNQSNESMIGQWPAGRIIEHRAFPLGFDYCLSVSGEATRATRA